MTGDQKYVRQKFTDQPETKYFKINNGLMPYNNKFYTLINSTGLARCSENGTVVKKMSDIHRRCHKHKQKKFLIFFENKCQIFMWSQVNVRGAPRPCATH